MAMKSCKDCGNEISKGAKTCPKCGKDQRNFFIKHKFITFILVIIVLGAISSSGGNETAQVSSTNQKEEVVYNVGETIATKEYEITIDAVKEKNKVGNQYLSSTPAEGGVYVAIDFKYKNISDAPLSSWDFPTVELVDSKGVEYSSDISASSYYATEMEPDRKVLSDLNPNITVTDNKVFEVSSETYNSGEWFLVVDNTIKIKIK